MDLRLAQGIDGSEAGAHHVGHVAVFSGVEVGAEIVDGAEAGDRLVAEAGGLVDAVEDTVVVGIDEELDLAAGVAGKAGIEGVQLGAVTRNDDLCGSGKGVCRESERQRREFREDVLHRAAGFKAWQRTLITVS